jgi:hypothetical protein
VYPPLVLTLSKDEPPADAREGQSIEATLVRPSGVLEGHMLKQ